MTLGIRNVPLTQLAELQIEEESIVFDAWFNMHNPMRANLIQAQRIELNINLDHLQEAQKYVSKLRTEIVDAKAAAAETEPEPAVQ